LPEAHEAPILPVWRDVWVDRRLEGGQDWWAEIVTAVRRCDLFLLALSPAAIQSYACDLERRWAGDLRRPLLPVLVDVRLKAEHRKPELSRLQWIPYRTGDPAATAELLNVVSAMPAAPGLPSPSPDPPAPPASSTARELPIGQDGLPMPVTVHELARTARLIRLRVEWGMECGASSRPTRAGTSTSSIQALEEPAASATGLLRSPAPTAHRQTQALGGGHQNTLGIRRFR
jgi:hypothetical protein